MTKHRTLRLTLNVRVRDLTPVELEECGLGDWEDDEDCAPDSEATDAGELARMIAGAIEFDETQDEMFAGSGILLRITDADVAGAEWLPPFSSAGEEA